MLSQKRLTQFNKHDDSWTGSIEKWWRRAAGYSRLHESSSPPPTRRGSDMMLTKLNTQSKTNVLSKPKPATRRASTARPVVIVERTREARPPRWNNTRPVLNINEEFIEVFYWTQSRYNYPGQLERYRKNLCYCCADCPACQVEVNRTLPDKHRPLSQGMHTEDTRNLIRPKYSHGCNGNYIRTSYT